MGRDTLIWFIASATVAAVVSSCVLDVVLASRIDRYDSTRSLRQMLFAGFALQVIAIGVLCYHCMLFAKLHTKYRLALSDPSAGAGFNAVAIAVEGIALIWLACLPKLLNEIDQKLLDASLVIWAIAIAMQCVIFFLFRQRFQQMLKRLKQRVDTTKYESTPTPNQELTNGNRPSFCSRDTTLASRPCTPASTHTFSLPSSTTKVASSIRSKLTRTSARSSLELSPFPASDPTILGSAFDRYDTSNIAQDMRVTVLTPSNMIRSGLEPIPGSRPGSPEQEDSSPMLPSSPALKQTPQSPTPGRPAQPATPSKPSPPNFSRPKSRARDSSIGSPTPVREPRVSASMIDLIHPLFRPDSPAPPQILTSTTMVTASPLANQPITPKTLNRLRSASDLQAKRSISKNKSAGSISLTSKGEWRVIPPSEDVSLRPRSKSHSSTAGHRASGSESGSSVRMQKTNSIGSPGPSIVEEDGLPPILPSFVLSAGSRSSLVGYGKRKSTRRPSAHFD